MTMFSKAATGSFTAVRPSKAQRNTVVVRAGAYDEELVQTAVRGTLPIYIYKLHNVVQMLPLNCRSCVNAKRWRLIPSFCG